MSENCDDGVCWFEGRSDVVVSKKDEKLKEFIELCSAIECCVVELTRERDSPRLNDEYFQLRNVVVKVKNEAIVEAFNSKCFDWKF